MAMEIVPKATLRCVVEWECPACGAENKWYLPDHPQAAAHKFKELRSGSVQCSDCCRKFETK